MERATWVNRHMGINLAGAAAKHDGLLTGDMPVFRPGESRHQQKEIREVVNEDVEAKIGARGNLGLGPDPSAVG
jgi:hypothetical protein